MSENEVGARFVPLMGDRAIPLAEGLARATFTVLVADALPTGWAQMPYCECREASPVMPVNVVTFYFSATETENLVIHQMAAADAPERYRQMLDQGWQELTRGGTPIKIRSADGRYAEAHLERGGTFAFLRSQHLTTDELATVAAGLRPASETGCC
jgi:hypothetical protein